MPVDDDLWTCQRCGAVVADLGRHQKWHDKLEGTHKPESSGLTRVRGKVQNL